MQVQTQDEEQQEQKRQGGPQQTVRRFALGSEVLESEEPFPEPAASDMWEGEVWDVSYLHSHPNAVPVMDVHASVAGRLAFPARRSDAACRPSECWLRDK